MLDELSTRRGHPVGEVSNASGLGALVWLSWEILRIEQLYATLLAIALLGILSTWGIDLLTRRLIPWRP